jgi:hypothetical protein
MATLRSVNTEFWTDEYIAELSRDAKLLFLYFLTNPLTNITGAYKIGRKKIKQDTDFTDGELDALLAQFEKDEKVIYRDGWIFLPNFLKNQSFGGNLPKTAIHQALETPDWAQAQIAKTIQESPKLTAVFLSVKDLVLCLKTKSGCLDTRSTNRKELNLKEDEEEPQTPKQGSGLSPIKPKTLPKDIEAEIQTWLNEIAPITGAKDGKDIAYPRRWREVVEQCVRAERFLPKFLDAVRFEFKRLKDTPQFFTPEGCLKTFQADLATNGNGTSKAPAVRTEEEKLRDYGRLTR